MGFLILPKLCKTYNIYTLIRDEEWVFDFLDKNI